MRPVAPCLITAALLLLLGACAQPEQKPSPFRGFYKNYGGCRADYAAMDARVVAAGVGDASYSRVPGYPYLRTDRTLASFRHQVHGLNDISEWSRRMREFDQESRDYEYINLGMDELERATQRDYFLNCGRILAAIELEDPAAWAKMVETVPPPDAYSGMARALGLYPLLAVSMKSRVEQAHQEALREYAQPFQPAAPLRLWTVKPKEDLSFLNNVATRVQVNALGFPGLIGSEWRALAENYAPPLWVETQGEGDVLAAPVYGKQGVTADLSRPQVYYQFGFARTGSDNLVQITYSLWFKSGEGASTTPIDGLIWRVTLDRRLQPLSYESLHASGADHRWHPVQALTPKPADGWWQEPRFVAPEMAPATGAALRLAAGTHAVRRVVPVGQAAGSPRSEYELHLYEELYTLPRPEGGTRSLFGPDGLVVGSQGVDPVGGTSSGILSPGALRQLGHHAIAHVGRRHFDDPYLLDSSFVLPPSQETARAAEPAPEAATP